MNEYEIFKKYPDVVNIQQLCEMLGGICTKTAYTLLKTESIKYFKIGNKYMIPKCCIIEYIKSSM